MGDVIDVFLSYAREDRDRARPLAEALETQGFKVWWDVDIPPGKTFSQVIDEALRTARCVVVLWTRASVRSEWVEIEAAKAKARHALIPVLLDDVAEEVPLEFGRMQAADLIGWAPGADSPGWLALLTAIREHAGRATHEPPLPAREPPLPAPARRPSPLTGVRRFIVLSALAYVAALAIEYLLSLRLFRLREIGNASQLYGRELSFDLAVAGLMWLAVAVVAFRAGVLATRASIKGGGVLTWLLGPLPLAVFLYALIIDSQRYSDGPAFSFPYYAVLTNAAGYHLMLLVVWAPVWFWLARRTWSAARR